MRALCARQRDLRVAWRIGGSRQETGLDALMSYKAQTGTPLLSATPILPEQRGRTNLERVQQHANLAWLCSRAAIPLTMLAQGAGTTTANAGSIDHAQASISLPTLLMREQVVSSRAQERPIGLEREIGSGEAPRFPGCGRGRWTISRGRSRRR